MEQAVTFWFTLPISRAVQLLEFAQTLGAEKDGTPELTSPGAATADAQTELPAAKLENSVSRIPFVTKPLKLSDLLDEKLHTLVVFLVEHDEGFYNKDLAVVLGVDAQLTSIYLGHLTKKLRKVGVDGRNWYTKQRTPRGTYLTVRHDVMEKFRHAVKR